MIGPMYGKSGRKYSDFRIFFSGFWIIPSSYPQGMIPGYDEGMIGPMYGKSGRKYSDFRIFFFGFSDHTLIIPSGYDSRV